MLLVHLTDARLAAAIRRGGIRTSWHRWLTDRGVFCMPVLQSYVLTNQWGRELRKSGYRSTVAVRFRVPDDESVTVSHYTRKPLRMTAAKAAALISAHPDPRGYEVFLPRPVRAAEIHDVRHVKGVIGWRHQPDAHGRPPCPCPCCLSRGEYGSRTIRARAE